MQEEAYKLLEDNARTHWWNTSKDAIVIDLLRHLGVPHDGNIVDLGAGTGYFLSKLDFTRRYGIDSHGLDPFTPRAISTGTASDCHGDHDSCLPRLIHSPDHG